MHAVIQWYSYMHKIWSFSTWSTITIHDACLLQYDCEDFLGQTLWRILDGFLKTEAASDPTTSSRINVSFFGWILRNPEKCSKRTTMMWVMLLDEHVY